MIGVVFRAKTWPAQRSRTRCSINDSLMARTPGVWNPKHNAHMCKMIQPLSKWMWNELIVDMSTPITVAE